MSASRPIYFDYHATTPVDPAVLEVMLPYFGVQYGNPANRTHAWGWTAEAAVQNARAQLAALIECEPSEIVFTSGATESIHLAVHGVAQSLKARGRHLITTATEHKCGLLTCEQLKSEGFELTILPVDSYGRVSVSELERALRPDTILVSIIAANNEIGTLNPIAEIGALLKSRGVLFHTDGAQAVGKIPVSVARWNCDLLSLSGHKMYAPKGVGALYVRRKNPRVALTPQLVGGGQERGLRAGTLNVPGIVGLGKAAEICSQGLESEAARIRTLRDRFWAGLQSKISGVELNGHPSERLPGNLNVSFEGIEGEPLILALRGMAFSTGSACGTGSVALSHVLTAVGKSEEQIRSSARFGVGRMTTEKEIDEAVEQMAAAVTELRRLSPVYASSGKNKQENG